MLIETMVRHGREITTSPVLANALKVNHTALIDFIKSEQAQYKYLGQLQLETATVTWNDSIIRTEVAALTLHQALLVVMSYPTRGQEQTILQEELSWELFQLSKKQERSPRPAALAR